MTVKETRIYAQKRQNDGESDAAYVNFRVDQDGDCEAQRWKKRHGEYTEPSKEICVAFNEALTDERHHDHNSAPDKLGDTKRSRRLF